MIEQGQRIHGIYRRVEDELSPLGTTGVRQSDSAETTAVQEGCKLFNRFEGCVRRFERAQPNIAVEFKPYATWSNEVSGHCGRTSNNIAHVFRNDLLIS